MVVVVVVVIVLLVLLVIVLVVVVVVIVVVEVMVVVVVMMVVLVVVVYLSPKRGKIVLTNSELGHEIDVLIFPQVHQRFMELMKLFMASTEGEVKDSTHEDSSSEEDAQGSESESELCSDQ